MALALYRKYRPATFAEVVGQEHVTEPLMQALASGRINHAYLFSGPRGCGKTSSARILARSLNCETRGPTPDPCGKCDSCIALAPDGPGSLDVIEIDAASHGGVDDARDLRERAFFAPVSSRYKVYIVDEAHMVSTQGFNALLKLVEEPPEFLDLRVRDDRAGEGADHDPVADAPLPVPADPAGRDARAAVVDLHGRGDRGRADRAAAGGPGRRRVGAGRAVRAGPAHRRLRARRA